MDRREAVARLAALTGSVLVGAELFVSGCARPGKQAVPPFTADDIALLDRIGEVIIPATDVPGAAAVQIGAFMAMMVSDCYDEDQHRHFASGLDAFRRESVRRLGHPFQDATPAERTGFLNTLDQAQRQFQGHKRPEELPHYFRMMKELTLLGYFMSEIGSTQALRYVESPGRFDGDVPYRKGDHAWVNPSRRVN